ncbi:MAG: hypothetical protein Q8M92_08010 [Candidatus Subteraquimicrobiales bacterium]|nr:hypothetical protein [Candidatus Subteraquimicrobiales bacterium]
MGRTVKDCFWDAEKCVPGSNDACSGCTDRGQSQIYGFARNSGTVPYEYRRGRRGRKYESMGGEMSGGAMEKIKQKKGGEINGK